MDGTNGTDGIDGINGTNGTNGTDGISGHKVIQVPFSIPPSPNTASAGAIANCPAGKKILGGGFFSTSAMLVARNMPRLGNPQGWEIVVALTTPGSPGVNLTAFAICANAN